MLENIFSPFSDWGLLILRLSMGIIFIAHGWPKLNPNSPIKGPAGFAMGLKQMGIPLPTFFAWVVVLLETVGAVLLILGLGTRILALGFAIDMLVAIVRARRPMGAKFSSMTEGIGWEFEFILLAAALALLFTGAGSLALDPVLGL
ncbi:MAG: DoxX family protein [Chloroflexi bacterium]|nr:DoxX family protein [Chloroflexota bacterium]MCI0577368.1 DoxX family protein [Chloroflexota bacterium]MCI0647055.1 DoxX family protein [Chloroflexota bacterium]MCI0731542.1 DoxX family protein [Chloroflexota bacterium]